MLAKQGPRRNAVGVPHAANLTLCRPQRAAATAWCASTASPITCFFRRVAAAGASTCLWFSSALDCFERRGRCVMVLLQSSAATRLDCQTVASMAQPAKMAGCTLTHSRCQDLISGMSTRCLAHVAHHGAAALSTCAAALQSLRTTARGCEDVVACSVAVLPQHQSPPNQ